MDRTPVWFMRQAGRIFPEYRQIRSEIDFLQLCKDPELNARVTCMPVDRLNVDAAIIFADILLILKCIGRNFEFLPEEGPTIDNPVRNPEDVKELHVGEPKKELEYISKAVEASTNKLPEEVPLIGFAGAPFTLACYLIEGGKSRNYHKAKTFMIEHPTAWNDLMNIITESTIKYLESMIQAGAEIIQLFDSWVGVLSPGVYESKVLNHTKKIFESLNRMDVPRIYFGTQTAGLLPSMNQAGADMLGIDWRIELETVRETLRDVPPLQGNLDPALLRGEFNRWKPELEQILEQGQELKGHIFNLGHGVLPDTNPDTLKKLVEFVRSRTSR